MMVWKWVRVGAMLAAFLMLGVLGNPVRRASGDPEARRRSAIDRSMIRFGRSYPAEPSAADIRELINGDTEFNRVERSKPDIIRFGRAEPDFVRFGRAKPDFVRFGRAKPDFVRFGRAQPEFIRFGRSQPSDPDDEMASVLEQYYGEETVNKREPGFLRFGRNLSYDSGEKKSYHLFSKGPKIDKGNKFIRLGRSGESEDDESNDERRKRSACTDCN